MIPTAITSPHVHSGPPRLPGPKTALGGFPETAPQAGITWSNSTNALGLSYWWAENRTGDFYRARYYDSNVGRFISEDPIGPSAGPDLYGYVKNNAINLSDPTGLYGQKPKVPEPSPDAVYFVCCKKGQLAVCEANLGRNAVGGASPVSQCEDEHEQQHLNDFKKDCPPGTKNFCVGQPDRTPVTVNQQYQGPSECRAYCTELKCLEKKGPLPEVQRRKLAVESQIKRFCGATGCPK